MEKRKIHKILKRVLPILCSVLVVVTALITPISAVVNVSHREEQGNYDLTERSTFPLTVGLAFDIGDSTSIFTTSVGGFGQQNNASAGGSDSFDWLTTEQTSSTYLDGQLNYQLSDKITYSKQFYNAREGNSSNGYGTASIQSIKISVDGSTDLTQGLDCSSIVYKLKDVVINSSLIRKGNYVDNTHPDIILGGENDKDEFYSPDSTDYRYLVPHVILPEISATAGYLGTYNVKATIVDQWGVSWELDYSVPIDTRGADTDTYIPFLPMSIFDSYGKEKGDRDYNIGMSNTVLLADYQSYLDLDYYEYKSIVPDTALIVDLYADVGGENTLVGRNYLDLGEYSGQTFNSWISSVDGNDGYTITGGAGGITVSYLDSDTGYTYTGTITDSNGATVYGTTTILADNEYRARLYRVMTTINVAGETFSVPSGITWEQFLNTTYSRDMFRYGDFADGAGVQYKVAEDRWSYVYENLGIYIQDDEKITDNGQYYLEGLTWFFVDNDRYLAPLNSTWEYFVNNDVYDKDRFRITDFANAENGIQYYIDGEWNFITQNGLDYIDSSELIIEESTYYIFVDSLSGTWIINETVNGSGSSSTVRYDVNGSGYRVSGSNPQVISPTVINNISLHSTYITVGFSDPVNTYNTYYNPNPVRINCFNVPYNSPQAYYCYPDSPYFEQVRTITINSELDDVTDGDVLLAWLIANAKKVAPLTTAVNISMLESNSTESNSGIMHLASIPEDTDTMKWQKVEGTEYGRSVVFTLPLYTLTDVNENMVDSDVYSYPTFQKYITSVQKSGSVPTPQIDFTSWIGTATSGFLNMELMPNFSIGGVLAILIGFSIVMLFLKYFAGG